ncbi:hypothetical protein [Bradyrhizobium sp. 153]|uniref:hypothetical protein n=1 Tax=Bradyrhizobium sp. 153 TaxID=2782627 RepID=UPI001FFA842B|nr:hypothetical protein [Bradyrhizobium sp. 153]MCK1668605.1 hypothetical protein [Bradyrhizobium sp. 153]
MAYKHLTPETVARIAAKYDFRPDERTVTGNAKQADEYHGTVCEGFDGDTKRFWGCDSTGRYDAALLLDGYLSQVAYEAEADAKAHRKFCRDAYGD